MEHAAQHGIVTEQPQYRLKPIVFKKDARLTLKHYLIHSPKTHEDVHECLGILEEFFYQAMLRYPDIRMAPTQTRGEMSLFSELYDEVVQTQKNLIVQDTYKAIDERTLH